MATNRYSLMWLASDDAAKSRFLQWAQQGEEFVDGLLGAGTPRVSPSAHGFTVNTSQDLIGDWSEDYQRLGPTVQGPPIDTLLGFALASDTPALTWLAIQQDSARRAVPALIRSVIREWANSPAVGGDSVRENRDLLLRQWLPGRIAAWPVQAGTPATVPGTPGTSATPRGWVVFAVLAVAGAAIVYGRHKAAPYTGKRLTRWTRK